MYISENNYLRLVCKQIPLKLFANKPVLANLSSIGGAGKAGNVQISNNLSRAKAAVLINQSITGLFQREINLLKI